MPLECYWQHRCLTGWPVLLTRGSPGPRRLGRRAPPADSRWPHRRGLSPASCPWAGAPGHRAGYARTCPRCGLTACGGLMPAPQPVVTCVGVVSLRAHAARARVSTGQVVTAAGLGTPLSGARSTCRAPGTDVRHDMIGRLAIGVGPSGSRKSSCRLRDAHCCSSGGLRACADGCDGDRCRGGPDRTLGRVPSRAWLGGTTPTGWRRRVTRPRQPRRGGRLRNGTATWLRLSQRGTCGRPDQNCLEARRLAAGSLLAY